MDDSPQKTQTNPGIPAIADSGSPPAVFIVLPGTPRADAEQFLETLHTAAAETGAMILDQAGASDLPDHAPVLALLAGKKVEATDALSCLRRGWPLLVLEKSSPLAITLASAARKPGGATDPALREILATADLRFLDPAISAGELEAIILSELPNRPTLVEAWRAFASYDASAVRARPRFERMQDAILIVGVAGVLLAVIQQQTAGSQLAAVIRYGVILAPIATSILLAISHFLRPGNKWVLLRGAAEAVKREIYTYRVRGGDYGRARLGATPSEHRLFQRLESIGERLMQTEVNRTALLPAPASLPPKMWGAACADDGFSFLTPDQYIAIRIGDQLRFYAGKTSRLQRQLTFYMTLILLLGGAGTLLAAIGLEIWITVTTAVATALATVLKYQATEPTLVKYNQAAVDLMNVKAWWEMLPPASRRSRAHLDLLVDLTEKTLETETAGWTQQMTDALAALRKAEDAMEPNPSRKGAGESGG
jgi:hypothetical protein